MKKLLFSLLVLFSLPALAQYYPVPYGEGTAYIDTNGSVINQGKFEQGTRFSEGFAAVTIPNPEGPKRWFFIGKDFTVKIPYGYDTTGVFVNGLCPVKKGGGWFYIGTDGLVRIDGPFDEAYDFSGGFARVRTSRGMDLIDTEGNRILAMPYANMSNVVDSIIALQPKGTDFWFLFHLKGDSVLADSFYAVSPPVNGIVYADRLGGHMYLTTDGKRWSDRTYTGAAPFGDKYGCIREEKNWFLIDTKGKIRKDIRLLGPVVLNQPLNSAQNYNGQWGYLNREGRWVYLPN